MNVGKFIDPIDFASYVSILNDGKLTDYVAFAHFLEYPEYISLLLFPWGI